MTYIAMNRFQVAKGQEAAFEDVWKNRDRHLDEVPGFVEFLLLKGPASEEATLYSSHTIWRTKDDFLAWTKSEAFRKAHANTGDANPVYVGHPVFEGFEVVEGA